MAWYIWVALILLSLILIAAYVGVFVAWAYFDTTGGSQAPRLIVMGLIAFIAIYSAAQLGGATFLTAAAIAAYIIFLLACVAVFILLPSIDNKDLIKAARPILLFSFIAGLALGIYYFIKIFFVH